MTSKTPQTTQKTSKRRISPALVISCIALFSTLVGTALALPTNSVFSRHIADGTIRTVDLRDNAVKTPKIADNAVTSPKIADFTVATNSDLEANAVTTDKISDGSVSNQDLETNSVSSSKVQDNSLTASDLAANSVNSNELGSVVTRVNVVNVPTGTQGSVLVSCLASEVPLLGGGGGSDGQIVGATLQRSDRVLTTQSWRVDGQNFSGATRPLYAPG